MKSKKRRTNKHPHRCRCKKLIPKGKIAVSLNNFNRKNLKELLILFWTLNPVNIKDAFKKIFKREIFTDDFPLIIKHHKLGMDKVLYDVDFKQMLLSIRFDREDMQHADKIIFCRNIREYHKQDLEKII